MELQLERESIRFPQLFRCQLPIGQRADTYLAVDTRDGVRKFIKGPFATKEAAQVALDVQAFKRQATIGIQLPVHEHTLEQLIPDGFASLEEHQAGAHKALVYDKADFQPRWFHVCEDLSAGRELPMRLNSTKSEWLIPQPIINWKAIEDTRFYSAIPYSKHYAQSLYATDYAAAVQLVLHILLDWCAGVGGDLANRNFLYNSHSHSVWNVDIDRIWCFDWRLPRTQICSERTQKLAQFVRFLREHSDELSKTFLRIQTNVAAINDLPEVTRRRVALLTSPRLYAELAPCKRDASPQRS